MATRVNQPPARRDFWQALKELDFLSAFFSWFFMLLTRLSEPLMLLATLYVVAEAGVPAIALPALHNLAIGIMITAPEIILPGSFVVAARTQEQGGQHARVLFAVCWLFVGLTLLTLISLFVWHFTGASLAWLMCARCAAAVGYSILMRVMSHGHNRVQMVSVSSMTAQIANLAEQVVHIETNTTALIAASEQRNATTLQAQPDMSLLLAQVVEQLDTRYTKRMETMIERTVERVKMSSVQQSEQHNSGRARLSIVNGSSIDVNTLDTSGEVHALPADALDSDIGQQIRSHLLEDSTLSARALATRVGCSPTTASKWKSRLEAALHVQ
jgi:hypothetical protein